MMVMFEFIGDLIDVRLVSGVIGGGNCVEAICSHEDRTKRVAKPVMRTRY
jgi:hypothetical protein